MQQETIEKILSGDLDVYETVVRQYQGMLLGYAAHRLLDVNAAQDVVQLTFIRVTSTLSRCRRALRACIESRLGEEATT